MISCSSSSLRRGFAALLLLLLSRGSACGHEPDSVVSSRGLWGVTAGVNGAYVLPHNGVVKELLTDGRYATIAHLGASWNARAGRADEADVMYGIPRFELGMLVNDFSTAPLHRTEGKPLFDKPSTMGQMITPFAAMDRPLVRNGRFAFGYRMEQGLGIATRRYNRETNPENELIGGPVSIMVGLGFYADVHVTPQWTLGAVANFHHYSNGRTFEPNIGVNPLDAGLRAVYTFDADSTWRRSFEWFRERRRAMWSIASTSTPTSRPRGCRASCSASGATAGTRPTRPILATARAVSRTITTWLRARR